MNSIEKLVIGIISEHLDIKESSIKKSKRLIDDLGADSLDIIIIIMALESEFDIEIPDKISKKFVTVQDVINYIHKKVKKIEKKDFTNKKKFCNI